MIEFQFGPRANADYRDAFAYYIEKDPRTATRFELAFRAALDFIERLPEASPLCDEQHRYCSLKKFPYGIVYRVANDMILVVAVTHFRQLPGYWLE